MQQFLFSTKLTESYDLDEDKAVGKIREEEDKLYRFVKNAESSTALALGEAAYHKITDTTDLLKNVYQCLTANLSLLGGIVMATAGIAAGDYGYIQTFGLNASITVSGPTTGGTTIAAGDWLKGVNAASYMVRDGPSTAQSTYARNVQILQTVATTTTPAAAYVTGMINCT